MNTYTDNELYEMFVGHGTTAAEVRSLGLERIADQVRDMIADARTDDDDPRLPRANDGSTDYTAIARAVLRAAQD